MKKKVLALVCAAVMVMGMSVTAFAAGSSSSSAVVASVSTGAGQVIDSNKVANYFPASTSVDGGTVTAVDMDTAKEAINEAVALYGSSDAFIATVVDINVPNATFPYNLTIKCDNVWAGQTVTVLHKVNGKWERLKPSKLVDNAVTVTVNSFSPFAIVIDTNPSPKTGDIALMVSGLAGLFATGTIFTRKKR